MLLYNGIYTKILYFFVVHCLSGVHNRLHDDTITVKHNHIAQRPHARILHHTEALVIYDHVAVQANKCIGESCTYYLVV